ncbi:hypothetical protein [Gilvimarinus sp. DA14]|uniref:hypothetical protein n=1 Tax=Gilvimarinus sp. DA14 TaxID=2956798 RepID=UPI0020B77857|nr:hypothetical protein [Gilvimarinus sp. DA14]UTF59834.1 hypothetical protein NHM04_15385 [Gilvimarinus sp. DA14]
MALAILLWFIAALTILVSGVAVVAKVESRTAKAQMAMARVAAAGDGAALLYMETRAALKASIEDEDARPLQGVFQVGAMQVHVRAVPVSGLINLLKAPEDVLLQLFRYGAGVPDGRAQRLTASVVEWRRRKLEKRQMLHASDTFSRVQVLEDVMSAEGVTRDVFERIRYLSYASMAGSSEVNLAAAPVEVLRVLAGGNSALYQEFLAAQRQQRGAGGGGQMRIDTRAISGSRAYQRSVWIKPSAILGGGWNIYRKFSVHGVPSVEFDE